jgi:hypothetical protein
VGRTPTLRYGTALRASDFAPGEIVESNRAYQFNDLQLLKRW